MLPAFSVPDDDGAAAFVDEEVGEFEFDQITNPAAGEEKKVEDRRRPKIATKFGLSKQAADLGPVKTFRGQGLSFEFLDLPRRVRR